jgi:hypothetical protein
MKKRELFGEVAVRLGFVKPRDVEEALKTQAEEEKTKRKRRLIGLIMLTEGILDTTQLIAVLKEMEVNQLRHAKSADKNQGNDLYGGVNG